MHPEIPAREERGSVLIVDGRIARRIPAPEPPPGGVRRIDLAGRWLLPSFCDSHQHFFHAAQGRGMLELPREVSAGGLAEALLRQPGQSWILGTGWADPLSEFLRPTPRAFLDRVHPERPVFLWASDLHRALVNSVALRLCEIEGVGGGSGTGRHAGEPARGVLLERRAEAAWERIPPVPAALEDRIEETHRFGITALSTFDRAASRAALAGLAEKGRLPLRIRHSIPWEDSLAGDLPAAEIDPERGFQIAWVKLFLDGTLGSRTAWLHDDYSDEPGSRGVERIPRDELDRGLRAIAGAGTGVAIHAIGDRAVGEALEAIQRLRDWRRSPWPDRIEHAQLIDDATLERLDGSGVILSMQPCHLIEDHLIAPARWGTRCRGAFPLRRLLDRGIEIVLGSDAPIETADPWVNINAARRRQGRDGTPTGGWHPEEGISFDEAFHLATAGCARGNLLPEGWGSLRPGSPADLQVLEAEDPREIATVAEARLAGLMLDGEWLIREW
ncbi:MAG: amidohydrolase [Planctomycetota bacterium]